MSSTYILSDLRHLINVLVPEIRMQIEDDDEEEEEDRQEDYDDDPPLSSTSSNEFSRRVYDDPSPRASADSQDIVIESETSVDTMPSFVPPSPSSVAALSQTASILRASDTSMSPRIYPQRLSVASRMQSDRSPDRTPPGDLEDRAIASETSSKRNGDTSSTSTWGKVKLTLSGGRRSRTNSLIRDRRDHTDSSISRESGASVASARNDKDGVFAHQQSQQPFVQSASASASILSLAPYTSPRAGASPVPAASSADLLKYKDAKLFPFPGMKKLEEARNRAKGLLPGSSSTPDITLSPYDDEEGQQTFANTTPAQTPDIGRERKLSHQASDSRLLPRFGPPASGSPSPNSHPEYFDIPQNQVQTGGSLRLPMTLPGVKQWLSNKKIFSQSSSPSSPAMSPTSPAELRAFPKANKKPSLSDLLRIRKDNDLGAEWEDINSDKSRTPTTATSNSASTLINNGLPAVEAGEPDVASPSQNGIYYIPVDSDKSSTDNQAIPIPISDAHGQTESYLDFDPPSVTPSPPEPASTTPDPGSSVSDYPPHSTSESSSSSSSRYSHSPGNHTNSQGALVLERLDESLSRGSRSPMWASAIDDPPRKLVLSSPVFQVANSNTIKDRFLFLFTDLLVIAKPVMQDQDNIMDSYKPTPMDRKYIVKSVVLLRQLRINGDRVEPTKSSSYTSALRNPLIRTFVHQFSKDADHAVTSLFEKAGIPDDPVMLGQLLFRTADLDRARLGEYLSRRTSKLMLRTYLDSFGFTGMRVDKALRVFLLSVNIPSRPPRTLEYMLDAFAGRWYEANAGMIAYDKDVAIRLVRALVQLNDLLYDGISQEPGPSHPQGNVTGQSFVEAFKRWDPRHLVPDELLEDICDSLHAERLSQAPNPSSIDSPAVPITIKRILPTRLTYKVQSEPIVIRIPQPDAQLTIQLCGQDLTFDPPELSFSKSSEASFRVTGTSLGPKKMLMCRSGPNALRYSGLPLSNPLMVERAFMRNTFQVAFLNHKGMKRRYMFSVNDPLIRHQWTVSLKRQIETATSIAAPPVGSASPGRSKFHRAAEMMALKVLQDTLIGPETSDHLSSTIYKVLDPLASSSTSGSSRFLSDQRVTASKRLDGSQSSPHIRSQSRSQVYHRHAAGRNEMDLNHNEFNSRDDRDLDDAGKADNAITEASPRVEGRLWSGLDLELQCQQNSSIPLVLSFLQVGAPDHGGLVAS